MKRNQFIPFFVLLFLVIGSRFLITFYFGWPALTSPELTYKAGIRGNDLYYGVIYQSLRLIQGKPFDYNIGYGPASAFFALPFVQFVGFRSLYLLYISLIFVGYLLLASIAVTKVVKRYLSFLVLAIFYLGEQSSLGWERGNLDLLFGLITGILTIVIWKEIKSGRASLFVSATIGFVSGMLTNAKIAYFPFSIVYLFFAPNPWVSVLFFLSSFVGFSYLPLLFGSNGHYLMPIQVALMVYQKYMVPNGALFHSENHSLFSIASLFTNCIHTDLCTSGWNIIIITVVVIIFSIIVFVVPFIVSGGINKIYWLRKSIIQLRRNPVFLVLALVYADAVANLLPLVAYSYRLFYTLALIIVCFSVIKSRQAYHYFLTSLFFFLIQNIWLPQNVFPKIFIPLDARGDHLFLIVFYYFLMRALWTEMFNQKYSGLHNA